MGWFILLMAAFQIKHYLSDFVFQTDAMVKGKAIYFNWHGIHHSLIHGVFTSAIVNVIGGQNLKIAIIFGLIDFITHYHIDWSKMNFGCPDISNAKFWNHLGLDQMAHQFVYIGLVAVLIFK